MAGNTPQPGAERRSLEAGWVSLPAEGRGGPIPELAYISWGDHDETELHAKALDCWDQWWRSPMALMWSEFDQPALERLLLLTAKSWIGGATAAELSEVRQLEDRFGLNPVGRRKLYWRIEGVDTPSRAAEDLSGSGGAAEKGAPPSAGGKKDPRLRVVS